MSYETFTTTYRSGILCPIGHTGVSWHPYRAYNKNCMVNDHVLLLSASFAGGTISLNLSSLFCALYSLALGGKERGKEGEREGGREWREGGREGEREGEK